MSENFHIIGYDYTNLQHKEVAVDPDTKALLTKSVSEPYSGIINASEYDTLQDAIDAACTIGYRYVWIPAGTYEIDAPLSFPGDGFRFIGAGQKVVTIKATATMDALIKQTLKRHLLIGGFRLDGNADKASRGIWLEGSVWFSKFFDIDIRDIAIGGLYLTHSSDTELGTCPYWNHFENIQCGRIADRGTYGIILEGDVNLNTFINCTAAGNLNAIKLMDFDFGGPGVKGPSQNLFVCPDCGGAVDSTGIKIEDNAHTNTFINPLIEGVNLSMEIRHKSNVLIGGVFEGNTTDIPSTPNGLDCYYYKIGATTYGSWLGGGGVSKLSELEIDADKDWNAKSITNMGTLEHKGDTLKSGIQTEGRATAHQYTGAGYYHYQQVFFREKMSNVPSSITLSNAPETEEENMAGGSPSLYKITLYGFVFYIQAAGAGAFGSWSKKFVTVGN